MPNSEKTLHNGLNTATVMQPHLDQIWLMIALLANAELDDIAKLSMQVSPLHSCTVSYLFSIKHAQRDRWSCGIVMRSILKLRDLDLITINNDGDERYLSIKDPSKYGMTCPRHETIEKFMDLEHDEPFYDSMRERISRVTDEQLKQYAEEG